MIDDDSGEQQGVDEVAGVGRDESELEWLVRGCLLYTSDAADE